MSDITPEQLCFQAEDGWALIGDLCRGPSPRAAILISAGTGVPRRFYHHAATHLATRGAVVMTCDFRGIGESGSDDLANAGIDYPDWGQLDVPARFAGDTGTVGRMV